MENKVLWDLERREGSGSGIWSTRSMSHRNLSAVSRTGTMRGNSSVHASRIHMRKNNIHGIAIIKQSMRGGEAGEEVAHLCSMSLV